MAQLQESLHVVAVHKRSHDERAFVDSCAIHLHGYSPATITSSETDCKLVEPQTTPINKDIICAAS